MNKKTPWLVFTPVIMFMAISLLGLSLHAEETAEEANAVNEEVSVQVEEETATVSDATTPELPAEETRWLWAEIVSVDSVANQFTVSYLSYDSDEEKEITLVVDKDAKFENFKSLSDMETGDNVSVDYIMDKSGKATAKSISLQKIKPAEITPVPEAAPADVITEEVTDEASVDVPPDAPLQESANAETANIEAAGE